MLVMAGVTVKLIPLLEFPDTVTTTFPVVAALGTVVLIVPEDQLVTVAAVPLNLIVLLPWLLPKVVPVIVTAVLTGPEATDKLLMAGVTVKLFPLLATPDTVTTTFPVVAVLGTVALTVPEDQLVTVATVPLNLTVLEPCVVPKPLPVMVTDVPTGPDVGERLVMERLPNANPGNTNSSATT